MARERLYGWNGEMPAKAKTGQCAIVLRGMRNRSGEMHTGKIWAELIGPELATKQDPYRVVLYYIITLKGEGCIRTNEFDIEAVTRSGDIKHGVVVKTAATLEHGAPVETTEEQVASDN